VLRVLRIGPSEVTLAPVIRGLKSEGERVRSLLRSGRFHAVALSISPEELEAISSGPEASEEETGLGADLYMRELARFGPVEVPPPCFVEAVRAAVSLGMECFALDMDEEEFTEVYCREVGGWELIRHSLYLKRLSKLSFQAERPEDLVLHLDALLTRFKGHRKVEEAREEHMASSILALGHKGKGLLALVDLERFDGVWRRLKDASAD
jgi:hypothetical protein